MPHIRFIWLCALFVTVLFNPNLAAAQKRIKDRMYDPVQGIAVCFRRMNGTHQTGCTSARLGSTGVVHYVTSKDDLQLLLQTGTAGSYIAVMPVTLLHSLTPLLQSSEQITGVVVHRVNETALEPMSHEDTCPNRRFNAIGTCRTEWNRFGTGLLQFDYRFPVVYLNEEKDIKKIKDCFKKFNNFSLEYQRDRSLCALELHSFMFAAVDTPTCLRRSNSVVNLNPVKFCDPMGDQSLWASNHPLGDEMKYIVIAARLDTTSMFLDINSGADNPVTGLVTLLYTAKLLREMLPQKENSSKNVLFILFNGESYDYMGSQRILYDMEKNKFPDDDHFLNSIRPEDISLFIELNQLNLNVANDKSELHVHVPRDTPSSRDFITKLTLTLSPTTNLREHTPSFPPSSLQTFHNLTATSATFGGLILTDHGPAEYTNRYYNAIYDDAENIRYEYLNLTDQTEVVVVSQHSIQKRVTDLSVALAKAVYEEVLGVRYEGAGVGEDGVMWVDELFHCYLETANCKIHQAIQKKKLKEEPLSFYVGVTVSSNLITNLVGLTLAWFTGEIVKTPTGPCPKSITSPVYKFFNMSTSLHTLNETSCFRTSMGFTEAVSPAFIIEDYDWKSGQYSSWSESTWRDFSARLYLKPSPGHESMTMAIGSVTFVLSMLLVYFVKSRAHILFAPPAEVSPTSC